MGAAAGRPSSLAGGVRPACLRRLLFAAGLVLAHGVCAQAPVELQEVEVRDQRDAEVPFDRIQSVTTRDGEDLQRAQPSSIFEALRDVPGVSVNGGPRSSGMKFNIRGYSDSEDVQIRLDGVSKGFEKYRFGGTFIDPELLKSIQVQRGPSILLGSGALGGTVSATTKDAADFLAPGVRFGARAKASYATNNDEKLLSLSAYGRPTVGSDALVAYLRRYSNDITLPDGKPFQNSQVDTTSWLAKGSLFLRDDLLATASGVLFRDTGLQPFDATGGQPGIFGNVVRTVDDRTVSGILRYQPGTPWIDLLGTVGYAKTQVHDLSKPGQSLFANVITGDVNDDYDYDIYTVDAANVARLPWVLDGLTITTGAQYVHNERDVTRVTQNPGINALLYPGGFNPAQPPGIRASLGLYLQPALKWGRLTLAPGVRWDHYEVKATGGTERILASFREASRLAYSRYTPALNAAFDLVPKRLTAFYNFTEAFRPPLIDETFTQGAFSRCNRALLGPTAPRSGICGSLYRPETARNNEVGLSGEARFAGGFAAAKVVYFTSFVRSTLESIQTVSPGVVGQPGTEDRRGLELEAVADAGFAFARAGYAWIRGTVFDGRARFDLYDVPGPTFSMTVGVRPLPVLEFGLTYLDVGPRDVVTGVLPGNRLQIGRQPGYTLVGAFARFAASPNLEFRIAADNLNNVEYFLNDGFGGGIGSPAPGRNVRFVVVAPI